VTHSEVNTPLDTHFATNINATMNDARPTICLRIQPQTMDTTSLESDPKLHPQICEFPTNLIGEIQRAYIKVGPYQPKFLEYPFLEVNNHHH
jgi:hypothetical protein